MLPAQGGVSSCDSENHANDCNELTCCKFEPTDCPYAGSVSGCCRNVRAFWRISSDSTFVFWNDRSCGVILMACRAISMACSSRASSAGGTSPWSHEGHEASRQKKM